MTGKRFFDDNGVQHWHGPVDVRCHELAKVFEPDCADCLAWNIQVAIEDHLSDDEDRREVDTHE